MKALIFIFIKAPRKIFRIISDKFEYCYYRFFYSKRKIETDLTQKRYLVCGGENLADIANIYRELFPDRVEAKISETDLICEHVFDRLVSCPKKLSPKGGDYQPIAWHSDFKD